MKRSNIIPIERVHLHRRTLLKAGAAGAAALLLPSAPTAQVAASISATLTARDPNASPNAQSLYAQLVALENLARASASPMTIIGQHIEGQNELYNPDYGDSGGTTYVGYYYNKVNAITRRLPGFVEIDFGPGYDSNGWGIFNNRSYDDTRGLPSDQELWQYTDDVADLGFAVWKGFPRSNDGTYQYDGTVANIDGSYSQGFVGGPSAGNANGGSAAGIVGCTFHQPYPGSSTKNFDNVKFGMSQSQFDSVVDWSDNTPEYLALLSDLQFLADKLSYFAAWDVPVLFRPYQEMNAPSFWWGLKTPYSYQQLWQIMYNYLVNTRGLHNLIFVWAPLAWTPGGYADVPWDYYPGAGYVDVVAVDDYNAKYGSGQGTPEYADYTNIYYTALENYNKPRMLSESYYVPITSSGDNALIASPWVIWSVWGDGLTKYDPATGLRYNSDADAQSTYSAINQVYTGGSGTGFGQNFDWGSIHAD